MCLQLKISYCIYLTRYFIFFFYEKNRTWLWSFLFSFCINVNCANGVMCQTSVLNTTSIVTSDHKCWFSFQIGDGILFTIMNWWQWFWCKSSDRIVGNDGDIAILLILHGILIPYNSRRVRIWISFRIRLDIICRVVSLIVAAVGNIVVSDGSLGRKKDYVTNQN